MGQIVVASPTPGDALRRVIESRARSASAFFLSNCPWTQLIVGFAGIRFGLRAEYVRPRFFHVDMRYPFAVLFLYHRADPVTLSHLNLFRAGADGAPVIPLTDGGEKVTGSVDVIDVPIRCCIDNKWASVDTVIYRWFAKREIEAERYVIVEWDCLLQGSLAQFYQPVWNQPFCGKTIHSAVVDSWYWFRHSRHLFPVTNNFGVAPLAGILLAHNALERICNVVSRDDRFLSVFCENRIATAAAQAGIPLAPFPEAIGKLTAKVHRQVPAAPGIYHKVKQLPHAVDFG